MKVFCVPWSSLIVKTMVVLNSLKVLSLLRPLLFLNEEEKEE